VWKILAIALIGSFGGIYLNAFAQAKMETHMSENSLTPQQIDQRGKALKSAVQKIYRERKANGMLKSRNDIFPEIQQFFSEPLTFDTAEKLLQAAGLKVSRHSDVPAHSILDFRDNVVGILVLDEKFPQSVKFVVSLVPSKIGDYTVVGRVEADISVSNI